MTVIDQVKRWLLRSAVGYFLIGSIYYLSGYIFNLIVGKEIVFSPIIGFPLTVIGWPWMVSADLQHRAKLGLKAPTIIALISLAATVIVLFLCSIKDLKGKRA